MRAPRVASAPEVPGERALDLLLGGGLLLLLAPLLLVLALLVRLDSPGPALFRQERIGRGGRRFQMWKLRTMTTGAADTPHRARVRRLLDEGGRWQGDAEDPRITRLGRWLRPGGLDELPQLWNVLRGDMSLVGPRPALPYELEHWQPWHFARLTVRPGLTGLWQVEGRGEADFDEMVRLDLRYIEERSPWRNLAILVRTPLRALRAPAAGAPAERG